MIDNKLLQRLEPKFSNLLSRIDRATQEFQWRGYLLMKALPTIVPIMSEVFNFDSLSHFINGGYHDYSKQQRY